MRKHAAPGCGLGRVVLTLAALLGLTLGNAAVAQNEPVDPQDDPAAEGVAKEAAQEAEGKEAEGEEEEVLWEDQPYVVKEGKVDFGVYNGYRRYHSSCHTCHGPDGLGSSYAPALVDSIGNIGYEGFIQAVVFGIQNVNAAQQSVMPAFAEDQNVTEHVDDIWAYLKGRADGVVGRGRPQRLEPEEDPVWQERRG